LDGLAGCREEELDRLNPDDAFEFIRRQGIKGPRNAIVHACEPYGFLPLCLRLLSGAIREDPSKPNDIEAAENWHPPADLKDTQRQHHILQLAYDTMAKDRRDLLSRIAAMRGPVDYETAKVLSTYEDENELKEALRGLVARGLLFRREDQAYYDLHPIVRQYAYDRLGDKAATHKALKDYFDTVPKPDKVEGLDDLQPAIELFHHTIRAGGYEEALRIYRDRLADVLYFQIGAYDMDISLKETFFPDGVDQPPRLKDESDQAWLLNDLALIYDSTGQSRKARGLFERSIVIYDEKGHMRAVAADLGNLAESQMLLGELEQAESNLRREIEIDKEVDEEFDEADGHEVLGRLLAYMGRYDQAGKELETALGMWAEQRVEHGQCSCWSCRGLRAILMDEPKSALKALGKAQQFWQLNANHDAPVERDLVHILWLSGTANRRLGDFAGAEVNFNKALSRCRRIRLVEFEADILLEMAKLQWEKASNRIQNTGDRIQKEKEDSELSEQAKSLTREALEIADRCEYRLVQVDIRDFLAEMAFAEGDNAEALKHAEIAKERAWCDGPPYCYKKALDNAERMLAKLA
jgi:tetratricopeptide (TPR) repeat protein